MIQLSAVKSITRREVNDTLTDWRILLPIIILVFILPLLLTSAARSVVDVVGDEGSIVRIIPFVMLLMGFIPSSFSLIAALESFVGERERNSLEALLSMPISDQSLYLGKLLSSLMMPLLSSCAAVVVFALSLGLRDPELFNKGLNAGIITLILLLIVAKALVMVAGAVIISSHTNSVRAANLLASFVLLPTASIVQLEALLIIAERWDVLWLSLALLLVMAAALIRTGLGSFNREEILSREHEQLNLGRIGASFRAFFAEYHPAGTPLDSYRGLPFSPSRFYRSELGPLLREYRLPLLVSLLACVGGALAGPYFGAFYDRIGLTAERVGLQPDPTLGILTGVLNSMRTLFTGMLSTLSFGLFALLVPIFAFAGPSYVVSGLVEAGGSWGSLGAASPLQFIIAYVLPHGLLEYPAAVIGTAIGLRVGASVMAPPKGFSVGQNLLWSLAQFFKIWLLVVVPLYLAAGLVQQLITTRIVAWLY